MEANRLFGIGEPVAARGLSGEIDPLAAVELMRRVGFTAVREWMHIPQLLADPATPRPDAVAAYTRVLDLHRAQDREITGMNHDWYLAGNPLRAGNGEMYPRDLAPDSLYMRTLALWERSWVTLSALFPQVTQWEVGNEWNADIFLHPVGWRYGQPGFTADEKMDIAVDLMYFAARGIRQGNPLAKVVSFSPTLSIPDLGGDLPACVPRGYGIATALERVYQRIHSGQFWSDRTDDYFDLLAWHPYMETQMNPKRIQDAYPAQCEYIPEEQADGLWVSVNDAAYGVMARHGDGHKKVLITEFGFSDCGLPGWEQKQAALLEQVFDLAARRLPYIKTIHTFRLLMQRSMLQHTDPGQIGGLMEVYFGLFGERQDHYAPRNKAKVMQRICSGSGSLQLDEP